MKTLTDIREKQENYIQGLKERAVRYTEDRILKDDIDFIAIAGSVARGDFMPGSFGGKVDLFVVTKGLKNSLEDVFGPKDDDIGPNYYCTKYNGVEYQIKIFVTDYYYSFYEKLDEVGRESWSRIIGLYSNGNYSSFLKVKNDVDSKFNFLEKARQDYYYADFLANNEYKQERWQMRDATIQNFANMYSALNACIRAIYHLNSEYVPSEDRQLYYSIDLKNTPENYEELVTEFYTQGNVFNVEAIISWLEQQLNIKK